MVALARRALGDGVLVWSGIAVTSLGRTLATPCVLRRCGGQVGGWPRAHKA